MSNTVEFICGDAKKLQVKNNSVDLIITQAPFFQYDHQNYGGDSTKQIGSEKTLKKYVESLFLATKEMERVLSPTGSIFIVMSNQTEINSRYFLKVLEKTNLVLANAPFVWDFLSSPEEHQFGSVSFKYDLIFHFVKSPNYLYSNPYKIKQHPNGVWSLPWIDSEDKIVSKINNVGFAENSFRPEVPRRLIEMFSKPDHLVLDPFGGSGTTACEAYLLGRNAINVDISEEQIDLAKIRFDLVKEAKA
jgi:DNA modification methylase